jgi:hypothetical protein
MIAMKRFVHIMIGLGTFLNSLFAQQPLVLTYETHALQAGINNNMILCHYADPGNDGENMAWNFSSLQSTHDFTGKLMTNTRSKATEAFGLANTTLDEFNNRFYLNVERHQIEQTGYSTLDNAVVVSYEKPFIKMMFPFTIGDSYSGDFYGTMKMGDTKLPLTGTYEVKADGYGKLMLPGNITIENTLRVKTVKSYEMQVNGSKQSTEITTFRWYGCCNRYPLLVLSAIKTTVGPNVTLSYQAAYNNIVNSRLPGSDGNIPNSSIRAYPNPVADLMIFEYALADPGDVIIELYNNTGKKIMTLLDNRLDRGIYSLQLVPEKEGLPTGIYIIRANLNHTLITQEIVISK